MDSLGEGTEPRGTGGTNRRLRAHRLALILFAALPVFAQPAKVVDDVRSYITAPLHWRAHEWTRFGEGVALVLAVHAEDRRLLRDVQRIGHDQFFTNITPLGGGRGEELTFVMIGAGWLTRDQRMTNAGVDAFESSVLATFVTKAG